MIIVVSSIKGGTGKSTLSFNLSVQAFLKKYDLITYDLDFPQYSFTRYYTNRKNNENLKIWENHYHFKYAHEIPEFDPKKLYIIDTYGRYDEELIELHKKADIIITPINDSFIDINTIMHVENNKWSTLGHYYELIYDTQNINPKLKWFLVKNRTSPIKTKHSQTIETQLEDLSKRLGFILVQGPKDRSIYRELFNFGETILDIKTKLSISNITAKMEIQKLWKEIEKFIIL